MEFRINLFGSIRLSRSDRRLVPFPTARSKSLFCFLVLNRRRMYPRDVLAGVFWGDMPEPTARKNLRNDLWRIRGLLEPDEESRGRYLLTEGDAVGISAADFWVDVEEFESRIDATRGLSADRLTEADADALCRAVKLYRGDLMEEVYEDWCLVEQQRLKVLLLDTIERLMRYHEMRRDWRAALVYGQRVLESDPLREHILRDVMRYHYFRGNRPAALRQFEDYGRLLEAEMGIAPMRQTVRLRDEIHAETLQAGAKQPGHAASRPAGAWANQSLSGEVRSAFHELEVASARLRASIRKLPRRETPPEAGPSDQSPLP